MNNNNTSFGDIEEAIVKGTSFTDVEKEIVSHYGDDYITTVATEECAELIQAVTKCKRYGCDSLRRDNLIEEMADVMIILDELMIIYDIELSDVFEIIESKFERQKDRMAHGDK